MKPSEELVVVESSIPVSSKPFGEILLELPVKEEDLPSKEGCEVSEEEVPESKPTFDEVQVFIKNKPFFSIGRTVLPVQSVGMFHSSNFNSLFG